MHRDYCWLHPIEKKRVKIGEQNRNDVKSVAPETVDSEKSFFLLRLSLNFFFQRKTQHTKMEETFWLWSWCVCVCRHNPRLKGGVVWGQNNIVFSSVLEQCGSDPNRPRKETARLTIDERYQPAAGMKGGAGEICSTCHWSHEKQESRGRSNEMVDEKRRTVRRPSGRMGQVWHLRCQWGSTFFYTIARRVPKQDVSSGTAFSSFLLLWFFFCSSPDYHSNREFPLDFFLCVSCVFTKEDFRFALCGRYEERNCFGKRKWADDCRLHFLDTKCYLPVKVDNRLLIKSDRKSVIVAALLYRATTLHPLYPLERPGSSKIF